MKMKLNFILVLFLPCIFCDEEIIGFNLSSQPVNFQQNYVKISPDNFSGFLTQVTICLRVKFQFWNTKGIFESSSITLNSFPIFSGNLRVENFWYTFRWPDQDNISFRHHPHLHFFSIWCCTFASLHLCNFFPVSCKIRVR